MRLIHLSLRGWVAWAPDGWLRSGAEGAAANGPAPTILRRRVTKIGRTALEAAWEISDLKDARFVFASRHGEFERTLSLLETITEQRDVSPAEFTLSVHNALAGLLSIARHNRSGHTAIASGRQSFASGLLEAISSLEEFPSQPIVFVYYDEPLPGPYADFNEPAEGPVAIALVMAKTGSGSEITISCEPIAKGSETANNLEAEILRFLTGSVVETTMVGQGLGWHFRRVSAAAIS